MNEDIEDIIDEIKEWGSEKGTEINPGADFTNIEENENTKRLQKILKIRRYSIQGLTIDGNKEEIAVPVRTDYRSFVKLYITPEVGKSIVKLNSAGTAVLFYIMSNIKSDSNRIFLTSSAVCEATGISEPTYNRVMKLLKDEGWISKSTVYGMSKHYIINLERFAKGSVETIIRTCDIQAKIKLKRESRRAEFERKRKEIQEDVEQRDTTSSI